MTDIQTQFRFKKKKPNSKTLTQWNGVICLENRWRVTVGRGEHEKNQFSCCGHHTLYLLYDFDDPKAQFYQNHVSDIILYTRNMKYKTTQYIPFISYKKKLQT